MLQGTTPSLTFKFSKAKIDFSAISLVEVWITLQSDDKSYDRTFTIDSVIIDAETNCILVPLTQEDTLAMPEGELKVQVRMRDAYDKAYGTYKKRIKVYGLLKDGVI